jgi:hypothetical protein
MESPPLPARRNHTRSANKRAFHSIGDLMGSELIERSNPGLMLD